LANLLERRLQRRVAIYSARDFKTFVERTRQGDYDILLTAPHLAWLARQDAGYRPLLKYARPTRGLLVVKNTSPYRVPEDLRGQNIATPDAIAVATLAVEADMAAHGLRRNVDYQTTDYGSHLNSVMQVVNGRTAAAMLGLHPFMLLPADLRQQLRVLIETAPLSSLMYLTHPRLRDQEANAIRKALLEFATTPEGKAFMQHGGYGGFVAVDGSELRAFRPYALQAEEMMRVTH
jgi:phosphonate transport system substrate-binding protein